MTTQNSSIGTATRVGRFLWHYGEMVVANVNGEVTLKRLYREGERVRLQPANSMMGPIYASARDVMVQGVVVGLMRRF